MSSLHDRAMQSIYQQVLDRVCNQMPRGQHASLQLLIQRLTVAAGGEPYIGEFQLVVVLGVTVAVRICWRIYALHS